MPPVTDSSQTDESVAVITAQNAKSRRQLKRLSPTEAALLKYKWEFWARPNQIAPEGEWGVWLLMTGRGFGKTRAGAQWVIEQAKEPNRNIAMISRIPADARDVMVGGESGVLACSHPSFMPVYVPSRRLLQWPNGSEAHIYSSEKPDDLRGPNFHCAWIDELAKYDQAQAVWDTLAMAVRLPPDPRIVITTTPRPIPIIKTLLADKSTHITSGSIYDNKTNLSDKFFERLVGRYEGTYLGQQELEGLLISDRPGALWSREVLEKNRVRDKPEGFTHVVVAIDPPATSTETSAEAGIIVAARGTDGLTYICADGSLHGTPDEWGRQAVRLYDRWDADQIVGEVNNGGDMVGFTVRECAKGLHREGERQAPHVPYTPVRASRGKLTRAEPISAIYRQDQVKHIGLYTDLEDQMTSWVPGEKSPDRLDALVWALTALLIYGSPEIETWGGPSDDRKESYVRDVVKEQGSWFPSGAGVKQWV